MCYKMPNFGVLKNFKLPDVSTKYFRFGQFFALGFPIVSSLAQRQIPMQQLRIYRAWLPSVIFPKYGKVEERKKTTVNRLRRATKRG